VAIARVEVEGISNLSIVLIRVEDDINVNFMVDKKIGTLLNLSEVKLDFTAITRVIRFVPIVFVRFAGFEREYLLYLNEKRVKRAERSGAKIIAGVVAVESSLY